ncbi:glycosyltransferase family A protein [Kordiimonas gwangyangensis]|uniref:glycosyltransferase family A protein n=1 Tax=Kordiimonas gwangyangensis TaxID=288022 RepID=UPI0003770DB8|nr:glycosyltransferase [Kordiimonas gwangyangensis]
MAEVSHPAALPIGVVIPAYGHPRFLGEAIVSACTQETDRPIHVVVVDDGCRFEETGTLVRNLMDQYPGTLFYLRHKNTRLPGARNKGVRFLLDAFPDMDAIFFLDADNRLAPYSLEAYRKALGDDESVGWAYPDISFFGLSWGRSGFDTRETAPDYSVLKHLTGNISEAGSLVRASMFRNGVFYDETMRSGFEDWDFWLSALGAGYHGVRVKDAGFLYRRRAESMLADSRREEDLLIARMRTKHKKLYAPDFLMRQLHREAPTFAVISTDSDRVLYCADPTAAPRVSTHAEFAALVHQCRIGPREHFFPFKIALCADALWDKLQASGTQYLRWLFWQILRSGHEGMAISFAAGENVEWLGGPATAKAHMVVLRDVLIERMAWDRQGSHRLKVDAVPAFQVMLPLTDLPDAALADINAEIEPIVQQLPAMEGWLRHADRKYAGPDARTVYEQTVAPACSADEEQFPPVPWVKGEGEKWCAFVAVESASGHSVIRRRMAEIKAKGYRVFVILERQEGVAPSRGMKDLIAEADMVAPLIFEHGEGSSRFYLGRSVNSGMTPYRQVELETLAIHFDMLVADYSSTALEGFGVVRHRGAKAYLMLPGVVASGMTVTDYGRILAYEHAVDAVLTDDVAGLRAGLGAQGMPSEKIISDDGFFAAVPHAESKSLGPAVMAKALNWQPRGGYVFVVTYGRSGSTLVQTVLQSIDGYFMRGENENVLYGIFSAWRRAHSIRQRFDTRRKVPENGPWFGADEVDAEAFADRMVDAFIAEIVRPPEDARVVGFKEIRYGDLEEDELVEFLEFMRRFFPRARFVFNTRAWQDVAKSSWWQDMGEGFVENLVSRSDRAFARFAAAYPSECHTMRYEDYADSIEPFKALFDFLGEPIAEGRLRELAAQKLEH